MDDQDDPLTEEQILRNRQFLGYCRTFDIETIKELNEADTWYQEPETGKGPLHLVVESAVGRNEAEVLDIISFLLGNGAVWNQIARNGETPGCTARRIHGSESAIYESLISAGVRAELLLTALDKHSGSHDPASRNEAFLNGKLEYIEPTEDSQTLLDEEQNAIMMTWEHEIMIKSAEILLPNPGEGSILNIGFGLGLIDTAIQARQPRRHVIIEAHPDVLQYMRRQGWYDKPNVVILEGRWQDLVDDLADRETFDAIYYDPFEYYSDMYDFFDFVVALLNPNGIFSFFHGLGADMQTIHDVYTRIIEIELNDFGFRLDWLHLPIATQDEEWKGTRRRYWALPEYRLPICRFQ